MINLKDISKVYKVGGKPFYALNRVSLDIADGEMIAIQGRSGAGKSTCFISWAAWIHLTRVSIYWPVRISVKKAFRYLQKYETGKSDS